MSKGTWVGDVDSTILSASFFMYKWGKSKLIVGINVAFSAVNEIVRDLS